MLVPASIPEESFTWSEGEAKVLARERLETALARLAELGAEAIGDCLAHRDVDHIIISTLPAGPSRWLRMDLPTRVARSHAIPVTHLIGEPEPAGLR